MAGRSGKKREPRWSSLLDSVEQIRSQCPMRRSRPCPRHELGFFPGRLTRVYTPFEARQKREEIKRGLVKL